MLTMNHLALDSPKSDPGLQNHWALGFHSHLFQGYILLFHLKGFPTKVKVCVYWWRLWSVLFTCKNDQSRLMANAVTCSSKKHYLEKHSSSTRIIISYWCLFTRAAHYLCFLTVLWRQSNTIRWELCVHHSLVIQFCFACVMIPLLLQ